MAFGFVLYRCILLRIQLPRHAKEEQRELGQTDRQQTHKHQIEHQIAPQDNGQRLHVDAKLLDIGHLAQKHHAKATNDIEHGGDCNICFSSFEFSDYCDVW